MPNREVLNNYGEDLRDISESEFTDWSDEQTFTVASDPSVPSAPSLSVSSAVESLDLEITPPSTNTDGTSIVDLESYTVYYATGSGIDITNAGTYTSTFTLQANKDHKTSHTYATDAQHYFKAVANDKHGNASSASSEENDTPDASPVVLEDYTDNIANVIEGDGMIGIEFQPPPTPPDDDPWERWAGWKLYYADDGGSGAGSLPADPSTLIYTGSGPGFIHKRLDSGNQLNESYLYEYKLTIIGEDGTETSGTISDNSGSGYQPNGGNNDTLVQTEIFAERIVATDEVRADHIAANTITANEISAGAIDTTELAADAVTATKIDVDELSAIKADLGTVNAGTIICGSIIFDGLSYDKIQSISLDDVVTGSITSDFITINGDLNFHPASIWHSIMGAAYMEGYHSGTDVHHLQLGSAASHDVALVGGSEQHGLIIDTDGDTTLSSHTDVYLNAWSNEVRMQFNSEHLKFQDMHYFGPSVGHDGWIKVDLKGNTMYIWTYNTT